MHFNQKHGHAVGGKRSRAMNIYWAMRTRCENIKHPRYARYGGRGIKVCERWALPNGDGFVNFLLDMGTPPDGKSIDRINNNGDYEPSNCRWSTPFEQANNAQHNRRIEYLGQNKTMSEWSELTGIPYEHLRWRLNAGWSVENALGKPVKKHRVTAQPIG